MSIESFGRWWNSTSWKSAYGGGQAVVVKNAAMDAFAAGVAAANQEERDRVRAEAGGMQPLAEAPKYSGVTATVDDRTLQAMRFDNEYFIKTGTGQSAYGPYDIRRLLNTVYHYKKLAQARSDVEGNCPHHKIPFAMCQCSLAFAHWGRVIQVDTNGLVRLSDADVTRIAEATVKHAYAIRAEAARARLQQQQQQMGEEAKAREIVEIACGIRSPETPALEALKRKAADARVDAAVRDGEIAITNALNPGHYIFRFEHVIAALRNLVAAIKILRER